MFKIAEKTELNQISLTGVRAIVLAGLLIVAPRSLEEIRKAFISLNIMEDENSDDILRIDLNTLKIMGCEISRASQKTNYKYVLGKHPFSFKMESDELNVLKRAYNQIKAKADILTLLDYDAFFKKIASRVCKEETKEALLGISALKRNDINKIRDLMIDCNQGRTIILEYKKPQAKMPEEKEIVAQKLVFQNEKIYLYGYDLNKKENVVLLFDRIKSVLSRKLEKTNVETNLKRVLFKLETERLTSLAEGEQIMESNEGSYIIEGKYYNEFLAMQRILSLGSKCVVLEPADFRNKIVDKLKEMRVAYGN